MMLRILLALCLLVPAAQVAALSCLPYTHLHAYQDAAKAEESYGIVYGTLTFDETKLPKVDWNNQAATPELTSIRARLNGKSITHDGFQNRFNSQIQLEVACYGPWCAGAKSGASYLAFVEKRGSQWVLKTNPCGGFAIAEPSPEMLAEIAACFNGADCTPDDSFNHPKAE